MDLRLTKEQEEYRMQAREWLQKNIKPNWRQQVRDYRQYIEELKELEYKLYEAGYNGIYVPKEYGGQGLTYMEEIIFRWEAGRAGMPRNVNQIGKGLLVPTLLSVGTEEQKKRFIPKVLSGEEIWCQGYSEPGAGSDLAAVSTRAVLDGDEWVINGQKIWTSYGAEAHWCFVLARTDPDAPKHKGITYFLVPMNAPGITVRPLKQMTTDAEFCEVFFENVRIPKDSVVGNVNEGWYVANNTLGFERGTITLKMQPLFERSFYEVLQMSKELKVPGGHTVLEDTHYRQRLADHFLDIAVLRYHGLQLVSKLLNDEKVGAEVSLHKLFYSEIYQRFMETVMDLQGSRSTYWWESGLEQGKFQFEYLESRADTIHSGTSEIQRNIIAERVLGMPR